MPNNSDNFMGGFFDFNGDGKTDVGEAWMGYKILGDILEEIEEEAEEDFDEDFNEDFDGDFDENLEREYEDYEDFEGDGDFEVEDGNEDDTGTVCPCAEIDEEASTGGEQRPSENARLPRDFSTYNALRKETYALMKDNILFALLFLFFLAFPILWIVVVIDNADDALAIASFLVSLGVIAIVILLYSYITLVKIDYERKEKVIKQFQETAPPEEKAKLAKAKKRVRVFGFVLLLCVVAGISAIIASCTRVPSAYNKAIDEIRAGNYEQARTILEQIEDEKYKSTRSLIKLCNACCYYEQGQVDEAYWELPRDHLLGLTPEDREKLDDFTDKLAEEYRTSLREKPEKSSDHASDTAPTTKKTSNHVQGSFPTKGGNSYSDSNNHKKSSNYYSYSPKTTQRKTDDDPFDAKFYSDEEEFYYDHYDDFYDFYEAQDYYEEHTR